MRFLFKSSHNCRQFGLVQRFRWQEKHRRNFGTAWGESSERDFGNGGRGDERIVSNSNFPSTNISEQIDMTILQRSLLGFGSAIMSIVYPERGDMIATMGETTVPKSLLIHIRDRMAKDVTGSELLKKQPRITEKTFSREYLAELPDGTLGREYLRFLNKLHTSPDSRPPVQFVDDIELVYVMQRYRETHDFNHVLLQMPTTMLGEVTVKYFEAIQLGLPMCIAAAVFGGIRLGPKHRKQLLERNLPWILEQALEGRFLLAIDWENRFEQNIVDLQNELGISSLNSFKMMQMRILMSIPLRMKAARCLLSSSTSKFARFQSGRLGNRLKNAIDTKIEAKQNYTQEGAELRPKSHLWRAVAFTTATGLTAFSIASISEYKNTKKSIQDLNDVLTEFKRIYFGQQESNKRVDTLIATLIATNVAVFALWRFSKFSKFMSLFFTNGFASKLLCLPMLLSVFSHSHSLHMFANMYVLNSFSNATLQFLGKEEFLAFYLTGGVFASLVSLFVKSFTKSLLPSLGASGAIAALIGYVCIVASDAKISILFLPQFQFSAGNALIGILLFETAMLFVGVFTKFRLFDNAAHLGGLLFGIWYAERGEEFYRQTFAPKLVNYWKISGFGDSRKRDDTPVIIFDGKKHIHTTMDKLHQNKKENEQQKDNLQNFEYHKNNIDELKKRIDELREKGERLEADNEKKLRAITQQLMRRKHWDEYQKEKKEKQKHRKERILEERKRMRMEEDEGDEDEYQTDREER
ncbi:unnamed protein product [Meloidogyne enterolobii]|uniref:Uncharacterized protein n=1 Tax=Meloidogyne enterolobii TaxID=390850 RepID=A0ACB0Y9E6_MELEN